MIAIAMGSMGCGEGEGLGATTAALSGDATAGTPAPADVRALADAFGVTPIPAAPAVRDELFELGQALAFDKILSGDRNIACMTCHFPAAATADDRHLSLGEGGFGLGSERVGGAIIPRNAPPLFNLHALDTMFWDGRVDIQDGEIFIPWNLRVSELAHTPRLDRIAAPAEFGDVFEFGVVSAQAMFPVLSRDEMRGQRFRNGPTDNELSEHVDEVVVWERLMARLRAIPGYVALFEAAYPGTAIEDMNFAHAANALAGFEIRAFEARGSRWQQFLEGDDAVLSEQELRGAQDFFQAGCASCHSGPLLTDARFHNTGLPQFGPGKFDGIHRNDDFGRGAVTLNAADRYAFRTPPLVNIALTGPWGHDGQFADLRDFVVHYADPVTSLLGYDPSQHIDATEFNLRQMGVENADAVIATLDPLTVSPVEDVEAVVAFLGTLTDPASLDLVWTIPSHVPSGLPVSDGVAPEIGGLTAEGTVTFRDIATDPEVGLMDYERVPSARNAVADQARADSMDTPMDFFDMVQRTPLRARGMPGVVVFDFDGDGDEDVFVTNGPGAPNSLFVNLLAETGTLRFVDRAVEAGVAATGTDSSGACYGDIDNDGDHDLFVVADMGRSHFFRNRGDGTFEDISELSGAVVDGIGGTSCAFGDIDGDGLLDLAIARAWHQENLLACFFEPFGPDIQHNELYLNIGAGRFIDVSESSGIRLNGGLPPWATGAATLTWAIAMVDYDLDGDVDIIAADDQCGLPNDNLGGVSRGFLQIFDNDGHGNFTNRTVEAGTNLPSAWMGLAFGDFNSDGYMDFFSPSFGDWGKPFSGAPVILGDESSRWLLGAPGKTFVDPGLGEIGRTPFGWGATARDFDNDGDTDIAWHGGMDLWFVVDNSNPGSMMLNDGDANFALDRAAFPTTDHSRRTGSGMATADLDGDGFVDIITVSNFNTPATFPMIPFGSADREVQYFTAYDPTAFFTPVFRFIDDLDNLPVSKLEQRYRHIPSMEFPNGTITVELNSADNGNNWASVRLIGTAGLVDGGRVNRDGIGAVITFTPRGGRTVMAPVLGGASHLSQDSLTQGFGLGDANRGTVDVLWPGGVRNRLYDVRHGEQLQLPELPCSYDADIGPGRYAACVTRAVSRLRREGLVDGRMGARMLTSALRAYHECRD